MITESEMSKVLECALSTGGDFAELFFEDTNEMNIKCASKMIQGVKSIRGYGVGLYLLYKTNSVYVYSNNTTYSALIALAKKAAGLLREQIKESHQRHISFKHRDYQNPTPILIYPSTVSHAKKISALLEIDRSIRSSSVGLLNLEENYFDVDRKILIANSEGLITSDRSIFTRVRFSYVIGDEKRTMSDWHDYTKTQGFEALENPECAAENFKAELKEAIENLYADPISTCRLPVVIEAGSGGTLWHETCGHTLEASSISKGQSAFIGKLGEKIASERITLIDDGTLPGFYGSGAIDDEGHPRQKNVLIENGVLKQYMCDRLHGRKIGMASNGCGRRQNYTYPPTSRMSNTFLELGQDDNEEMISSLAEGLYVKSLGGGTGGVLFSIAAKGAYLIKNGKIDKPVRNVMLTGNGSEVIKKVDRVGNKMGYDTGGFCGADSGLIPTTAYQPRVRISEMLIGGVK